VKDEYAELWRLAFARYPNEPPALAKMQYLSDRCAAGLGALDQRLRRGRSISRFKWLDTISRNTLYVIRNNLPPRDAVPEFDPSISISSPGNAYVTVTRLPAVCVERWVRVSQYELDRFGRGYAAKLLRKARREVCAEMRAKDAG
jgi:hypothetical protein